MPPLPGTAMPLVPKPDSSLECDTKGRKGDGSNHETLLLGFLVSSIHSLHWADGRGLSLEKEEWEISLFWCK